MAIPKLGNVNGFVRSSAWLGSKHFEFDGTIKGLVKSAVASGAKAGSAIQANFAGLSKSGARDYRIIAAPHDNRASGFWADEIFFNRKG